MNIRLSSEPLLVIGLPLRTTNERAFEDIPAHWQRFQGENWLARIPHRVGSDVYAVYTHFEHEGIDNLEAYTLVVGSHVDATATTNVPDGLASVIIAPSRRAVFAVEHGQPGKVGERWLDIWADRSLARTFICDHEHYHANGDIDICVGIR